MRTKIETHNNKDYLTIHIDRNLVRRGDVWYSTEYYFDKTIKELPWIKEMVIIPGIKSISVREYEIGISKARVFPWDVITPKIVDILAKEYPDNLI